MKRLVASSRSRQADPTGELLERATRAHFSSKDRHKNKDPEHLEAMRSSSWLPTFYGDNLIGYLTQVFSSGFHPSLVQ